MHKAIACACGGRKFAVRIRRDEQVGLLTCRKGHHSLLLDSRDYWHDAIQTGKPRESRCRCGGRTFEVELDYEFRDKTRSVRSIAVSLRCTACKKEQNATTFEITYEPTGALLKKPLDPCANPWLRAKQTTLTAFWLKRDVDSVVRYLGSQRAQCYFAGWQEKARRCSTAEAIRAMGKAQVFDLFFSVDDVVFPDELRDCWKRLPVLHIPTPTKMNYANDRGGTLYYVEWAEEVLVGERAVPQSKPFLALAHGLRAWLATQFTSKRATAVTFDNPREYERLFR